jgi:hypothetical protein
VCHLTTLPWCATLPPYHGVPPYHLTMVCHLTTLPWCATLPWSSMVCHLTTLPWCATLPPYHGVPPYHLTMVCHLTTLPWCATLPPYHGVPPYHGASKLIAYARSRISLEVARKGGYLTCWHEGKGDWDVFLTTGFVWYLLTRGKRQRVLSKTLRHSGFPGDHST